MIQQPALRPRAERCPDPTCTDEQQCWRCEAEEAQHAGARAAADLDTARRRTVALVERIDAGRAWARQHLTVEQQTGLLGVLAGRDADTILATRDAELDRMRADRDRWQQGLEAAEAQLEHHRRTVDQALARAEQAEAALGRVRDELAAIETDALAPRAVTQRLRAALEPPKETRP